MAKAASGVAIFLISFLFSCYEIFAQANTHSVNEHSLSIILMKSLMPASIKVDVKNQSTVIKTCDFKTIRAQYAQLLKVKPDAEMVQQTKEQQGQKEIDNERIIQSKQNDIVKASQSLSKKFALEELSYADLQKVTPSASQVDVAIASKPETETSKAFNNSDFSQPLASAQNVTNSTDMSVSIRRTSGLLHNKSKVEQKYILSYKIHENEGE
jgi:hypothetical protein